MNNRKNGNYIFVSGFGLLNTSIVDNTAFLTFNLSLLANLTYGILLHSYFGHLAT